MKSSLLEASGRLLGLPLDDLVLEGAVVIGLNETTGHCQIDFSSLTALTSYGVLVA
jgi:hypothetical protein